MVLLKRSTGHIFLAQCENSPLAQSPGRSSRASLLERHSTHPANPIARGASARTRSGVQGKLNAPFVLMAQRKELIIHSSLLYSASSADLYSTIDDLPTQITSSCSLLTGWCSFIKLDQQLSTSY